MEKQVALKVAEIVEKAAQSFKAGESFIFAECVGKAFWLSFGTYEQSPLMQDVYCTLCDMGFTPLERDQ